MTLPMMLPSMLLSVPPVQPPSLTYQTLYYNQTLDHLVPFTPDAPTFDHRYLLNDTYFGHGQHDLFEGQDGLDDSCPGPIWFYAGNEGPIDDFWNANGFMQYLTVEYGGLLVFAEERYYGTTQPPTIAEKVDDNNNSTPPVLLLTTQQVLEDYVELLAHIKHRYNATTCPTIAFGGSYGATLAAYLRLAYPHAVQGAVAASSELGYYDLDGWTSRNITEYTFSDIVAAQYAKQPLCLTTIYAASDVMNWKARRDPTRTSKLFNFCVSSNESKVLPLPPSNYFVYGLEGLPQQNYPYEVGNMPAWPVRAACDILTTNTTDSLSSPLPSSSSLLERAAQVTAMTLGYDLKGACFDVKALAGGPGNVPGDGPGPSSWGYQSCTETLHGFSSSRFGINANGHLRDYNFTVHKEELVHYCQSLYGVVPNMDVLTKRYGGFDIARMTSNTIFSMGELDPWGGAALRVEDAGVDAQERQVHFFRMSHGAHHLDLRGWHPADPPDVTSTRMHEERIIVQWIRDYYMTTGGARGTTSSRRARNSEAAKAEAEARQPTTTDTTVLRGT